MIIGKPIVLHVTENEADVIQQALFHYKGPYGKDASELNPRDLPVHNRKIQIAENICEQLRDELTRRYEESQHGE